MRKKDLEERIKVEAKYIMETGSTIRTAAERFGISKSTIVVHMKKLEKISYEMYCEVRGVIELNKEERGIRGGEATKQKFLNL